MTDAVDLTRCVMCGVFAVDVRDTMCADCGSVPYPDDRGRVVRRCPAHPAGGPWVCDPPGSWNRHRNVEHGGAPAFVDRPRPWQLAWWRGSSATHGNGPKSTPQTPELPLRRVPTHRTSRAVSRSPVSPPTRPLKIVPEGLTGPRERPIYAGFAAKNSSNIAA